MQEVGYELQAIRQAHKEVMKMQKHSFKVEIEIVKKRLWKEEIQSALFAKKIKALKAQKQAINQQPSEDTPTAKNMLTAQPAPKSNYGIKSYNKQDEIDEIGNSQSPRSF